jgi:predicted nucleic acid-binding protein
MRRVMLDTNACVYWIRNLAPWSSALRSVFARAEQGRLRADIPGIVRLELLVRPFKTGNLRELRSVVTLTTRVQGVHMAPVDVRALDLAARIRAATSLRSPDALVIASAIARRCDAVIGNDRRFRVLDRLSGVLSDRLPRYIHLDDYIGAPA